MLDLLRDPIWQFVGAAITLASLPFGYWLFVLQKRTSELAVGVLSSRSLLSVDSMLSGVVTIQIDGSSVEHVHLVVFGVKNSGNVPVLASDFARPLGATFRDGARILECSLVKQSPTNLNPQLTVAANSVAIAPILLNPLDSFVVQVLVSVQISEPDFDVRVAGVTAVVSPTTVVPEPLTPLRLVFTTAMGIVALTLPLLYIVNNPEPAASFGNLKALIPVVLAVFVTASPWRAFFRHRYGPEARRRIDAA